VKIKKHLLVLLLLLGIYSIKISAQDIQFSQFYSASLFLNPAFAGSAHGTRGILHQRVQWPSLDAKYITSLASFDTYSQKYKSGFGLMVVQDFQGSNIIKSSNIDLQYCYELSFSKNLTLRSGVQVGYVSRYLNYSSLIYPDQLNTQGYAGPSDEIYGNQRIHYADVAAGGIVYSNALWVGFSAHHMNRPNQSFMGEVSRLPSKYTFVAGYKFLIGRKRNAYSESEEEASLIPTVHYKFQGMSDQLDFGIYAMYRKVITGFWYRGIPVKYYQKNLQNNESVVFLAGYKFNSISISYSYDVIISRLAKVKTGGSHEVNITYVYKKSKKKKPMKRLPCPKFDSH
jgi:type IX secretion system PorP/SprF family membrane protein